MTASAAELTIWLAFGAGVLSFISPCTLPLFPAYLSYITGVSVKELKDSSSFAIRKTLLLHSIFFLLGVSLIFMGLGIGVSLLGQWIQGLLTGNSGVLLQRLAGIFIVLMGFLITGWLRIPLFMNEKRMRLAKKPAGYLGTVFVGVGFAAGWTPCIGPIFASILVVAGTNPTEGTLYTLMYIIGFSVPFLVLSFFLGSTRWIVKYSERFMKIGGSIMIGMGVLLFTGQMASLSNYLLQLLDGTWFSNLG
ncbi:MULTISPECIES: cytochrome c biogenesis CcdA family protein [Pontibacillus]|uniref:Cytochrome c biogenesis protein CcdA n=1 Tax=Pontibacillus chungwhensis TaxID=265426 RepID=A0ABY8UXP3_9BACI|nr:MULTISPECIES: cytochrome c biogenesis protein CcdA [Pontibacillus]MCD5325981.1 cytochrome c biogenesis protein CcdA [Pontibacillus sp. HN14]WIF98436.1 cytochrome c biogenesis protein CcdA [Pontibacillus chungwhensis]